MAGAILSAESRVVAADALAGLDAVILAGGLGTRLASVLPDRQKVVGEIAGRPLLHHLLHQFSEVGISRLVLALGHRAEQVTAAAAEWARSGIELLESVEPAPLGTGGALRHALPRLRSDTLLVANGDSFAAADLASLLAFHRSRRARITLLLVTIKDASRYGRVRVDATGAVIAFDEKPAEPDAMPAPTSINAGIYLMDRDVVAEITAERPVLLEREVIPAYIGKGLYGHLQLVPFIDIGTPESCAAAEQFFAARANGREA